MTERYRRAGQRGRGTVTVKLLTLPECSLPYLTRGSDLGVRLEFSGSTIDFRRLFGLQADLMRPSQIVAGIVQLRGWQNI